MHKYTQERVNVHSLQQAHFLDEIFKAPDQSTALIHNKEYFQSSIVDFQTVMRKETDGVEGTCMMNPFKE